MIQKKLLAIQKENLCVKKDAKNPFFKSEYTSLDEILNTFSPILTEKGIVCFHRSSTEKSCIITTLYDIDSDTSISSEFPIFESNDPQKIGSTITYWKRYNLGQLLNITTEKDDDWNKASEKEKFTNVEFEKLKKHKNSYKNWKEAISKISKKYLLSVDMQKSILNLYMTNE